MRALRTAGAPLILNVRGSVNGKQMRNMRNLSEGASYSIYKIWSLDVLCEAAVSSDSIAVTHVKTGLQLPIWSLRTPDEHA